MSDRKNANPIPPPTPGAALRALITAMRDTTIRFRDSRGGSELLYGWHADEWADAIEAALPPKEQPVATIIGQELVPRTTSGVSAALPPEGRHQEEVIATLREIWDRATAWRLNEDPKRLIDWIADVAEAALGKHETSQSYRCKALQSSDPNASECDWPECGCDPYALRVLEASQERQRKSSKDSRRTEP